MDNESTQEEQAAPTLREQLETEYNSQADIETAVEEHDEGEIEDTEAPTEEVAEEEADEADEEVEVGAELPETLDGDLYIPKDWSEEEKQAYRAFAKADREAAEKIGTRFKNIHGGFHDKSQELSDYKRRYEGLEGIVEPLREQLALQGQTVESYLNSLVSWDKYIASNPQEAINKLAQNIGLDLTEFMEAGEDDFSDPEVSKLKAKYNALEQQIAQQAQAAARAEQAKLEAEVNSFKNAKDASGDLAHPHFEEVRAVMSALSTANPSMTLDELYVRAVRAEGLEAPKPKAKPKSDAEKKAEIAQAKKKSKSVSTTKVKGSTTPVKSGKSLRAELEEQYNEAISG